MRRQTYSSREVIRDSTSVLFKVWLQLCGGFKWSRVFYFWLWHNLVVSRLSKNIQRTPLLLQEEKGWLLTSFPHNIVFSIYWICPHSTCAVVIAVFWHYKNKICCVSTLIQGQLPLLYPVLVLQCIQWIQTLMGETKINRRTTIRKKNKKFSELFCIRYYTCTHAMHLAKSTATLICVFVDSVSLLHNREGILLMASTFLWEPCACKVYMTCCM